MHSLYISRYPMGREATLNYPSIDNQFRTTPAPGVLIRAFYSGRRRSRSRSTATRRAGRARPRARTSSRRSRPRREYIDDPALPAGSQKTIETGHTGYVVENFRIINTPGQPEKRERYVERYSASPTKIARGTGGAPPPPTRRRPPPPPAAARLTPGESPAPDAGGRRLRIR